MTRIVSGLLLYIFYAIVHLSPVIIWSLVNDAFAEKLAEDLDLKGV